MKTFRTFLILTVFALFANSCNGPDPIEGENTYSVENSTDQTVQVVYTFSHEVASWAGKTDSINIAPQQRQQIVLFFGGLPDWTPSHVFTHMVFLSEAKDTLLNMDVINDADWILTDSIINHGYFVGYYHWTYNFSNRTE